MNRVLRQFKTERLTREKKKRHFSAMIPYVRTNYDMQWFHESIARNLQRVQKREVRKLMLTVPPQHGKSTIATQSFPAFCLGQNNREKIVIASYSATLANSFNRANQRLIAEPEYQRLYPDVCIPNQGIASATNDLLEVVDRNQKQTGGFIKSVGRGGSLTGFPADIAIIDDPLKDRKEAQSHVIREALWQWYVDVFCTRLHNNSVQVVIQTRWHEDDLCGRLLAQDGIYHAVSNPNGWVLINYEAIKTSSLNPDDHRSEGDALWPQRHSLEKLLSVKANNETTFDSLYQGDPRPPRAGRVYPDWQIIDEMPDDCDSYFYGLDFGFMNDPTALVRIGKTGRHLYIEELIYETGMTNQDILKRMRLLGIPDDAEIYGDSAEQKSIEEIRRGMWTLDGSEFLDGYYVIKAIKGPGSRVEGVSKMQEFKVYMVKSSTNLIRENRNYQYIMIGNKPTNEPEDGDDHCLDGSRYAVYTRYHPRRERFAGGDNS